jgi:hypothetical protein
MLITCHSEERSEACPEPFAFAQDAPAEGKNLVLGKHAFFYVRARFRSASLGTGRAGFTSARLWLGMTTHFHPAKMLKRIMEGAVIRTISSLVIPLSTPFGYALVAQLGPKYQLTSVSQEHQAPHRENNAGLERLPMWLPRRSSEGLVLLFFLPLRSMRLHHLDALAQHVRAHHGRKR